MLNVSVCRTQNKELIYTYLLNYKIFTSEALMPSNPLANWLVVRKHNQTQIKQQIHITERTGTQRIYVDL